VLLDALDGVVISDTERSSPTWLAGVRGGHRENLATVITCGVQQNRKGPAVAGITSSPRFVRGRSPGSRREGGSTSPQPTRRPCHLHLCATLDHNREGHVGAISTSGSVTVITEMYKIP
jgi:hypothetical protein